MSIDERIISGMRQQRELRDARIADGARQVGWKVGFGSPAALKSLRIDRPLVRFLLDAGMLAESDLRTHPKRSELRSALGIEEDELEIGVTAAAVDVLPGDAFLLCTDGLWEHMEGTAMERLLAASATPAEWVAALSAEVRRNTVSRPKHDNYSALAVWVTDGASPA